MQQVKGETNMKAIVVTEFGKPNVMKYVDMEMPVINAKQVLIEVHKTSVNYADVKARYGNKSGGDFPFVPGLDAAGVIVEVGSEVRHLCIGQRVVAFPSEGSYAEYVVAEENLTFVIPSTIDFDIAAPVLQFRFCPINYLRISLGLNKVKQLLSTQPLEV